MITDGGEDEGSPYLKAAILEVVDNQIRDNDPPETSQTYARLVKEGHSKADAKRLIGCVVVSEIFDILKKKQPFDLKRYVEALGKLPELPKD